MSKQKPFSRLLLGVSALSGFFCLNSASADSLDTWNVSLARSMAHHRNVNDLVQGNGSDTVTTDTFGLKIDKPYSLQRFELNLALSRNNYQRLESHNFTASNYTSAWRWALTPSLHGNLTSTREKGRGETTSYSNLTPLQPSTPIWSPITTTNVRTDIMHRFDADYALGGGWHGLAGVFSSQVINTDASRDERDNTLKSSELGGRYDFTSGSSLGFVNRMGRGSYDKSGDEGFDQVENTLAFSWPLTVKTRLDTRIGYFTRNNDNPALVDFGGTVGAFKMTWEISGKSRLSTGLTRNLSGNDSRSYSTLNRFFFSPVWQISTRTALRFHYDYIQQDYLDAAVNSPNDGRRDIKRIGLLAMDWQPLNALSVSVSLTDDRRTSNVAIGKFKDTIAQLSLQIGF